MNERLIEAKPMNDTLKNWSDSDIVDAIKGIYKQAQRLYVSGRGNSYKEALIGCMVAKCLRSENYFNVYANIKYYAKKYDMCNQGYFAFEAVIDMIEEAFESFNIIWNKYNRNRKWLGD